VLNAHPELMAYFIYADEKGVNCVYYSPALESKIKN
jgi:thiamine biosynthesis lipoprotein